MFVAGDVCPGVSWAIRAAFHFRPGQGSRILTSKGVISQQRRNSTFMIEMDLLECFQRVHVALLRIVDRSE